MFTFLPDTFPSGHFDICSFINPPPLLWLPPPFLLFPEFQRTPEPALDQVGSKSGSKVVPNDSLGLTYFLLMDLELPLSGVSLCSPFPPVSQPLSMSIICSKTTPGPGSVCLYVCTQGSTLEWAMFFLIGDNQGRCEGTAVQPCLTCQCCNLGNVFGPVYLSPGQGQAWPMEPLISGAASQRQENKFAENILLWARH